MSYNRCEVLKRERYFLQTLTFLLFSLIWFHRHFRVRVPNYSALALQVKMLAEQKQIRCLKSCRQRISTSSANVIISAIRQKILKFTVFPIEYVALFWVTKPWWNEGETKKHTKNSCMEMNACLLHKMTHREYVKIAIQKHVRQKKVHWQKRSKNNK